MDLKKRDISEYSVMYGNAEPKKISKLHSAVLNYRDSLLENTVIQDVLLNDGYSLDEEERPTSYQFCWDSVNGRMASAHLYHLEFVIDVATVPKQIIVRSPEIGDGEDAQMTLETPEGYDAKIIENLQTEWLQNSEIREKVRKYQSILTGAQGEYVAKFILGRMGHVNASLIDLDWTEEYKLGLEIEKVFDKHAFNALDSAYYNMANRLIGPAGHLHKELLEDKFGKLFVLSRKEATDAIFSRR